MTVVLRCYTCIRFRVQFLRDLRDFFGVTFKIEQINEREDEALAQVRLTCLGIGYTNISKRTL